MSRGPGWGHLSVIVLAAGMAAAGPATAARPLEPGDLVAFDGRAVRLLGAPLDSEAILSGDPLRLGGWEYCQGAAIAPATPTTAIVFDWERAALVRVDLASGFWSLLSSLDRGEGPRLLGYFELPPDLAIEADGSILLARPDDFYPDAILRVDPVSGDRVLFAEAPEAEDDPDYFSSEHLTLDLDGTILVSSARAWYRGPGQGFLWVESLLAFDPESAERSVRGHDLALATSTDLAIAPDGTLYAVGAAESVPELPELFVFPFVSVSTTGELEVVSGHELGSGPEPFLPPDALAVLPDGTLVASMGGGLALFRIDPATGDRSIFAGSIDLRAPGATRFPAIASSSDGSVLAVACPDDQILHIDPLSGARDVAFDPRVGTGATPAAWEKLAVDGLGRIVVSSFDDLIRIDPVTGDRSVWSVGEGTDDVFPTRIVSIAMTPDSDALVSRHQDHGFCASDVLRVDARTGARTVVSGSGAAIGCPSHLALAADGTLWVSDGGADALVRVDLATGDRAVVSDATHGAGPIWFEIGELAVRASGELFVLDDYWDRIYRVSPDTGDRVLVLDGETGDGTELDYLRSITADPDGDLVVTSLDRSDFTIDGVFRIDPDAGTYERISTENLRQVTAVPRLVPEPAATPAQIAALAAVALACRLGPGRRRARKTPWRRGERGTGRAG